MSDNDIERKSPQSSALCITGRDMCTKNNNNKRELLNKKNLTCIKTKPGSVPLHHSIHKSLTSLCSIPGQRFQRFT